ncbi:MAG: hypothetical protein HXX18_11110 [Bacteroidetes bacterium]|nr:hypothetical protein [Bacteroidota bacterium]
MKKAFLFIIILFLIDIVSAEKMYIPLEKQFKNRIIQNEKTNNLNEQMRRKRGRSRGRRGKASNFAIGGSITTMKLFESIFDNKFRIGLGTNVWLNFSESSAIKAGVYYFLPISNEYENSKNTSSYLQVNAHFQQFLAGSNKEDFGFYAFGGFGYIVNFNNTETPTVNINARYTNVNLDVGIGSQFNLNFAFLFVEVQGSLGLLKFEIPTNPSDGINVPSFINFRAGVKFPLKF